MERHCQSDSAVVYGYQRERERESDIERFARTTSIADIDYYQDLNLF